MKVFQRICSIWIFGNPLQGIVEVDRLEEEYIRSVQVSYI